MWTNLRRWAGPPHFEGDEDKTRAAMLLNSILWISFTATLLYSMFAPIRPELVLRRALIIVPFMLTLLALKQLVNWGYVRPTGRVSIAVLWLLLTSALVLDPDEINPAYMGYLVVVVCAGLILTWRAAILWSILCILTSAVILVLAQNGILAPESVENPPFAFWLAQTLYIVASTVLISQAIRKIDQAFASAQREIDQRKRVEAERETIIKELEAKNAELERFTYTVSHDLKSPLITISGFIGLLEMDVQKGDTEKFKDDLSRIHEAAEKMKRLLDELLELSRIGRLVNVPSEFPFGQIVEEALSLVRGRLQSGNINVHVQSGLPVVHGDRPRLVEVLQNLIDNAAKFMGDQPHPQIEIGARREAGERIFFVSDNGIGVEPDHHDKIFGLFDKLDPRSEGTGVGLALAKRIVEVHGGRIWVESARPGSGSTFCFTLPNKEPEL